MHYSPKLKQAAEEIKAILEKYDIAGSAVLHTPGFGEYIFRIDPSYSCAFLERGQFRLKTTDLLDDATKKKALEDTVNMLLVFSHLNGNMARNCGDALRIIASRFDIETTPGNHTSHEQQNN